MRNVKGSIEEKQTEAVKQGRKAKDDEKDNDRNIARLLRWSKRQNRKKIRIRKKKKKS